MPMLLEPNKSALERRLDDVEQTIQRQRQAGTASDPAQAAGMQQARRDESPIDAQTRVK
jgi:hypothetical protein